MRNFETSKSNLDFFDVQQSFVSKQKKKNFSLYHKVVIGN